jgi:Ni,Fe-hydrogenase I large subunit
MSKQSSSCPLWLALLLPSFSILFWVLALFLPSPLSAQSFQDEKIYQVQGKLLNRLEADLQTAKQLSVTLEAENGELRKQSNGKLELLSQLQTQLQTVNQSLKRSEDETAIKIIGVGVTAGVLGYLLGWVAHPK